MTTTATLPITDSSTADKNGRATAALVLGILGCLGFGLILGVPAMILGYLGLQASRTNGGTGKGQAISGLVLGALSIVPFIAAIIFIST